VSTLGLELLTHCETALVEELLVPRGGSGNTSGEDAGVVGNSDGERAVMKTETLEAETRNGNDVSNTRAGCTSDHVSLLLESQLGDELLGLFEALFPSLTISVGCTMLVKSFNLCKWLYILEG
jgi:hypothetical protein